VLCKLVPCDGKRSIRCKRRGKNQAHNRFASSNSSTSVEATFKTRSSAQHKKGDPLINSSPVVYMLSAITHLHLPLLSLYLNHRKARNTQRTPLEISASNKRETRLLQNPCAENQPRRARRGSWVGDVPWSWDRRVSAADRSFAILASLRLAF
jgi:hypothetical protein